MALPAVDYCAYCPEGRRGVREGGISMEDGCEENPIMYAVWIPVGVVSGLLVNYLVYKTLVWMGNRRKTKLTAHVMEHLSLQRSAGFDRNREAEENIDIISPGQPPKKRYSFEHFAKF